MFSRSLLLALALIAPLAARAQSNQPAMLPADSAPMLPHCADIAAMGPHFDLLANACQYALSQENLPNFICQEDTQRFTNGRRLDVVTEEVTFAHGHDRYSERTINGQPVKSLKGAGGLNSNAAFGAELTAIFRPDSGATFKFDRMTKTPSGPAARFDFHFKIQFKPGFNPADAFPGMSGSIWIDQQTGHLLRVDVTASELDPAASLKSYKSTIVYREVPIPDLGNLLLPMQGQVASCLTPDTCFKNQISFHNCRKFGSEVRILPNE